MAEIPINAAVPRNQWTATAGQTVFAYEWPIFDETDLSITQTDDITGVVSDLTLATHYTVQGVGGENGGTITLVTGALVDDIITLNREVVIKRTADFEASGDFESVTLNREMDLVTMMLQEAARDWARAILLDPSDPTTGLVLPLPTDRAGKFIAFSNDAAAELIAAESIPDTAVVSAFGATLIDDADADTAKATLELFNPDGGMTLTDTDVGAGEGPALILDRNSASPAQSDLLGSVIFRGRNDLGEEVVYAKILAAIADETDGSEDVFLRIFTIRAGTEAERVRIQDGVQVGLPTDGDKGAGTVNAAGGLYDDGSRLVLPRGHIDGLILSNNGLKDIDITAGAAMNDGQSVMMVLPSAILKKLDASWVVGTNGGGLDGTESVAGTPDADTWYHCWLIRRSDTGVVDVLFSESATAPTMPTDYDQKRLIGGVLFDATPDIIGFEQTQDYFQWNSAPADIGVTNLGASSISYPISVPPIAGIQADIAWLADHGTTGTRLFLRNPDTADIAPGADFGNAHVGSGGIQGAGQMRIRTDASGQIAARSEDTNTELRVRTIGYVHPRGRNA